MKKRRRVFNRDDYIFTLREYFDQYCKLFFGVGVTRETLAIILDRALEERNERYKYPLYFIWLYDDNCYNFFLENGLKAYVLRGGYALVNMLYSPRFNDYIFHRMFFILNIKYKLFSKFREFHNLNMNSGEGVSNQELYSFFREAIVMFRLKHNLFTENSNLY
jgi:hypothetical protein